MHNLRSLIFNLVSGKFLHDQYHLKVCIAETDISCAPRTVITPGYRGLSKILWCWFQCVLLLLPNPRAPIDQLRNLNGYLLFLGTWSHLWYIQMSAFVPFFDLYFLPDLWDWLLFVIHAISFVEENPTDQHPFMHLSSLNSGGKIKWYTRESRFAVLCAYLQISPRESL
jgi:hypothetical protein